MGDNANREQMLSWVSALLGTTAGRLRRVAWRREGGVEGDAMKHRAIGGIGLMLLGSRSSQRTWTWQSSSERRASAP